MWMFGTGRTGGTGKTGRTGRCLFLTAIREAVATGVVMRGNVFK